MKRLLALASLLLSLESSAAPITGWVGIPLIADDGVGGTVAVPDVVGEADFATADGILEGEGLDGFEIEVCSAATENEVVSQDPTAGTIVALGTIVDVRTSTGAECAYDLTGIPSGWYSVADVLVDNEFLALMRQQADGDAVWAYWLPGDIPHNTANLILNVTLIQQEADTNAGWGRWAPGGLPRNSANLQLDMLGALSVDFALTP